MEPDDDLVQRLDEARQLREQANEIEASAVKEALKRSDSRVKQAAARLGLPHRTLDTLIRAGRLRHLWALTSREIGRPRSEKVS